VAVEDGFKARRKGGGLRRNFGGRSEKGSKEILLYPRNFNWRKDIPRKEPKEGFFGEKG